VVGPGQLELRRPMTIDMVVAAAGVDDRQNPAPSVVPSFIPYTRLTVPTASSQQQQQPATFTSVSRRS